MMSPGHTETPSHDGIAGEARHRTPTASIVTTVYNRAAILGRAMRSVLDQSFTDYEYILVDDGSTDGSADVAESFADPRVRVLRCPHRGRAAALNTAFAACRGEFILIQDSDDVALPGRFEKQIAFLREHPEVGMVGCQLLLVEGETGTPRRYMLPLRHEKIVHLMLLTSAVSFGASAIRRSCAGTAGAFDETLPAAEDYAFQLKMLQYGRCANLPFFLQKIHVYPDSQSVLRGREQQRLTRDLAMAFVEARSSGKDAASSGFASVYDRGRIHYYHDEIHEARRTLAIALRLRPLRFGTWRYLLPTLLGPSLLRSLRGSAAIRAMTAFVKRRRPFRHHFLPLLGLLHFF